MPMMNQRASVRVTRSPVLLLGVAAAVGLGALAVFAAWQGFLPGAREVDATWAVPNLLTGLASLAGAVGYGLRRRWGVILFALSVLGHFAIHAVFVLKALEAGRATPISLGVLALVPLVALVVLASMAWQWRQGRLA
jgi:hypothetical protein